MRFVVKFSLPVEPFNAAVRDGSAGPKIQRIIEACKPESMYFWEDEGQRGGIMVVNIDDPSELPGFAEPLFLSFNAKVSVHLAMTPEDLGKAGLEAIAKKFG